jgi:hypothetical protein
MAAPSSAVDICNLALDRLGQRTPISATALTAPSGEIETVCARHYDQCRRELLRKGIFNFARKYDILEKDTDVSPAFGFTSSFYTPADCLRLLVIGDIIVGTNLRGKQYDIVEHHIYTSFDDAGDLSVEYIKDAQLVEEFDSLFIDCLTLVLAKKMAYKFTLKPSAMSALNEELKDALQEAKAIAGQERPPRRIEVSRLRDARRFGFNSKNNTRYPF